MRLRPIRFNELTFETVNEDHPDVSLLDAEVRANPVPAFVLFRDEAFVARIPPRMVIVARYKGEVAAGALMTGSEIYRLFVRAMAASETLARRDVGRHLVEHVLSNWPNRNEDGGIFVEVHHSSRNFWVNTLERFPVFEATDGKVFVYPGGFPKYLLMGES